jgi:hypothetical protein
MAWGRNGGEPGLTAAQGAALRYGRRSILLAGIGLLVIVALALLTLNFPGQITDYTAIAGAYILAPLLHVAGIGFAIAGLLRSPRKGSAAIGLILNLVIIASTTEIARAVMGVFFQN